MKANIVVLPGDGIGPEVIEASMQVLEIIQKRFSHSFTFNEQLIGGCAIDETGIPLPTETLVASQQSDAVLLGAVGGPKWDDPSASVRPEQGLLQLRKALSVFANLRPVKVHPALVNASPLKPELLNDVDLIVIRELTGGLYFGQPKKREIINGEGYAVDTLEYHEHEVRRIVELAFKLASERRGKVTSVDKANVLESSRLWRQVAIEIGEKNPEIPLDHMLVDAAAMRLISNPRGFDIIVTENMFGDILTDEASILAGSMGMLPSASIGSEGPGLFEPIHGSAPDIAGKGIANPIGTILSTAMMLRYSLSLNAEASAIETAVEKAILDGCRTVDLGGNLKTDQITKEIIKRISG
jgi:3-isopropylmalate dehydrogenase